MIESQCGHRFRLHGFSLLCGSLYPQFKQTHNSTDETLKPPPMPRRAAPPNPPP